jgi:hypothetical protein
MAVPPKKALIKKAQIPIAQKKQNSGQGVHMQHKSSQRPEGALLSVAERRALKTHRGLSMNGKREFLPMLKAVFFKGTQTPTLRLKLGLGAVSSNGSGVINYVYEVTFGNLVVGTDWDDVFDEFRIIRGHTRYVPFSYHVPDYTAVIPRDIVCYVDYDDSTPLTSKNLGWDHDNAVVFNTQEERTMPEFLPDFTPDLDWYNCQTDQTHVMGAWKFYSDGCSNSVNYGEIFGWIDVQFRQT